MNHRVEKFKANPTDFPFLGFGVGLRPTHYDFILKNRPQVDWFEAISENHMGDGGRPSQILHQIRENYPVVLHGVSLSIGSYDPLDSNYLKRLKNLADAIEPAWISDHLCWTGVHGHNAHDLLPLPYTQDTLNFLHDRLDKLQNLFGKPFVLENASTYLEYTQSTMKEWDFLKNLVERSGCKLLLDINNVYVNSVNHNFNPMEYLTAIPTDSVVQFHLAGHTTYETHLLDTHDHPIKEEVWSLYKRALERFGPVSTLIERDDHIPPFDELNEEVLKAKKIWHEIQ